MSVRAVAIYNTAHGLTPEQILEEFPDLDLARIYAALAYYHANKAVIDADIQADRKLGDRLATRYPRGLPSRPSDST